VRAASVIIITLALAGLTGAAARSASSPQPPTVTCDSIILTVGSGRAGGYRVVLGVVSVPSAYLPQVVRTRGGRWPYWRKAGLVIRGGSPPVTVSVAKGWRDRAAITWGNSGDVSALRIASCPPYEAKRWNAYAGGFLLRSRSACVPLVFQVGDRRTTVRFGLGRHCA
jgi:hypothetical protein